MRDQMTAQRLRAISDRDRTPSAGSDAIARRDRRALLSLLVETEHAMAYAIGALNDPEVFAQEAHSRLRRLLDLLLTGLPDD